MGSICIEEILTEWLREHGYEGFTKPASGCECSISEGNLLLCGDTMCALCQPTHNAEALRDAVIEEARHLCTVVLSHSADGVRKDGLLSGERQIIDVGPLYRAVARLQEAEKK